VKEFNAFDEPLPIYSTIETATNFQWHDPYFDASTPRNVTGLVGKSAYLTCKVRNLGNKTVSYFIFIYITKFVEKQFFVQVSWIRHRDIHILTVGSYTYTSDQRFQATHHRDTDEWTLTIKWAQKRGKR
jgi:hypothetical protein